MICDLENLKIRVFTKKRIFFGGAPIPGDYQLTPKNEDKDETSVKRFKTSYKEDDEIIIIYKPLKGVSNNTIKSNF